MEKHLDMIGEEQPPCPNSVKKSKATEKWMDRGMKEFYRVRLESRQLPALQNQLRGTFPPLLCRLVADFLSEMCI